VTVDPPFLLARRVSRDAASPLITWYDDATGARVELSGATFANAVAKSAGLLADGIGLAPGDEVGIALPLHWQAAVAVMACWTAGCVPVLGSSSGLATFVTPDGIGAADADDVIAVSLAPLGGRVIGGVPAGVTDHVDAAAHGDTFHARGPVAVPAGPPYPEGARVLSVIDLTAAEGIWWGLLGPLSSEGSAVLVANPDAQALVNRCEVERVTHTAGIDVAGLPRLD
jgi:uncharacterized protein (TIGR03089 family)